MFQRIQYKPIFPKMLMLINNSEFVVAFEPHYNVTMIPKIILSTISYILRGNLRTPVFNQIDFVFLLL